MPDTTVKYFHSSMTGAPQISGEAGKMIGVLDACLVNGFGSVTLDSLVVASNVATGTVSGGHGFEMIGGIVGPVITISGATPSGLNGEWRIASVPGSTTFTFATTGISDQTATGTIAAKRAPAGFSKAYSGTNKAAYRTDSIDGARLYLRVDNTSNQLPALIMYETMSDIDTGTGPSPTSGNYLIVSSTSTTSTARPWRLFADNQCFYYLVDAAGNWTFSSAMFFGNLVSYKPTIDFYGAALIAHVGSYGNDEPHLYKLADSTASLIARSYTQSGSAVPMKRYSHGCMTHLGYRPSGPSYPNPADSSFHAWPVEAWEEEGLARGLMPGLWNPIHHSNPSDRTIISDIPQLPSRKLFVSVIKTIYRAAFDLYGPWR